MASVEEVIEQEEIAHLRELASQREWLFEHRGSRIFLLGLPARDTTWFHLLVDYQDYRGQPPAWHWSDESGTVLDASKDTPKGTGFLHSSGRICAPWNRLAYTQVDPKGPHRDWNLAGWESNPKTRKCRTLSAMALRVYVELNSNRCLGERFE